MSEPETSPASSIDLMIASLRAASSRSDPLGDKASKMGLIKLWAYHCYRCNYVWLPKDFDIKWDVSLAYPDPELKHVGEDLIFREPPKACARCKSRYWNQLPHRNTEYARYNDDSMRPVHDMWTKPRLRALHRQGILGFAIPYCRCKHCKAFKIKSREKG